MSRGNQAWFGLGGAWQKMFKEYTTSLSDWSLADKVQTVGDEVKWVDRSRIV